MTDGQVKFNNMNNCYSLRGFVCNKYNGISDEWFGIFVKVYEVVGNDDAVMLWISENGLYNWTSEEIGEYWFEDETDAMAFKLTWDGINDIFTQNKP